MFPLIVDALASGQGKRLSSMDVIGAGPRSIAGVFEQKEIKPFITPIDTILTGKKELDEFDLLLVSGMSSDIKAVRKIVSIWKKDFNKPVVIGGPVASDPEKAILKTNADLAVIGEGELTILDLIERGMRDSKLPEIDELSDIRGIAYRKEEAIHVNDLKPVMKSYVYEKFIPSTDTIEGYPLFRSARVYIEVLRGCSNYYRSQIFLPEDSCKKCNRCRKGNLFERYDCPFKVSPGCGYCSVPSLYGPSKSKPIKTIIDEIKKLLNLGVRRLVLSGSDFLDYGRDHLVDPLPLTNPRHPEPNYSTIEELLSRIHELDTIKEKEASIILENVKGCLVTKKAAMILGNYLGGSPVNIGFETGSKKHSMQIGRASTPDENLTAVMRLKKAGLKPYTYFIHGLPGQDAVTADQTVKTIKQCVNAGSSRIILYRFQPIPMSAFYRQQRGPPAMKNILSKKIYDSAKEMNNILKMDLVGKKLRSVIAEPYEHDRSYFVAYPMLHGPVIIVEKGQLKTGELVDIEVTDVMSERMVRGKIINEIF